MPKYRSHLSTFKFGEVSPKFDGRTDLDSYRKSCKQLKNFLVQPSGIAKRYGTKHLAAKNYVSDYEFANFDEDCVLIPYSYSDGEEYIIILTPNVLVFSAYEISTGRFVEIRQGGGTASVAEYEAVTGVTFTSYTTEDTSLFQYSQVGDVLWITHPKLPPFFIVRALNYTASGIFKIHPWCYTDGLSDAETWEAIPYDTASVTEITLTNSGTTGTITLTASAAFFKSVGGVQDTGHVGSIFALKNGSTVGYCIVTAITSTTVVDAEVITGSTLPASAAQAEWYEAAWSPLNGWPRAVTHVNARIAYGGNLRFPDSAWLSQEFDYFQMTLSGTQHGTDTAANTDNFTVVLLAGRLSEINWMRGNKGVVVFGTSDGEYTLFGPNNTLALGAIIGNHAISTETSYGSEPIQVQNAGSRPLFIQRGTQKIRDFQYSREAGGYVSNDISVLAEHFIRKSQSLYDGVSVGKIKQVVFQKANDEILWILDTNGYMWGMTRSESNGITAFHEHSLGGFSNSGGDEPPKVLAMAVNKSPLGTNDDLYLLVERYIDGGTKIYLERLTKEFEGTTLVETSVDIDKHPVFMDSALLMVKQEPTFFASYDTSLDADTADGSVTGTGTGSPATPAGDLDLSGGGVKYVSYDGTSNVDTAQVGCIRFLLKLDFLSGALAANFKLFSIAKADSDADNLIELSLEQNTGLEEFRLTINSSSGAAIINNVKLALEGYGLVDSIISSGISGDHFVEIELNYDLTNGVTQLFVNGAQVGDTITSTGTRDTDIDLLRVGSDYTGADAADAFFKDFQFYDTVQHTENYKPTLYWDGSTSVKGLDILEGESVRVLRDGNAEAAQAVSSGAITLDEAGTTILIGLAYTALLETMEIEDGSAIGSAQGAIKRVDKVYPRFYKSANCSVGSDVGDVDAINFRDSSESISDPITLKTGIREPDYGIDIDLDHNRQATVYLESSDPLPCNVSSLTIRGVTGD